MPTDTSAPAEVVLKACPFCGNTPKRNGRRVVGGVRCTGPQNDHLVQAYGATQADAAAAWNTRAQPLAADALDAVTVEAWARAMCNAAWASVGEDWSLASDEQRDEFRLMARACLALISGKTVGADQSNTSPDRVNETQKSEHDGKTVGAGEGDG